MDKNREGLITKLKECEQHINKNYDVEALNFDFPKRLQMLVEQKGRRLKF